jgi:uncharacterized protein (TIGR02246 family)
MSEETQTEDGATDATPATIETTIDPELQAVVTDLLTNQALAWQAGDAAAFTDRAAPDVVFTNVVGMFSLTKDDFVAQHERIFGSLYRDTSIRQTVENVAQLTPDAVLLNTYVKVDGAIQSPPGVVPIQGVIHLRVAQLLVRRDGEWRIAAYTNIAVRPGMVLPE